MSALGFALYHDTPLTHASERLGTLLRGAGIEGSLDTMTFFRAGDTRKARRKRASLDAALAEIASGRVRTVVLASRTDRPAGERVEVTIECGTVEMARAEAIDPWLFRFMLAAGPEALTPPNAAHLACAIADLTNARAGVVCSLGSVSAVVKYLVRSFNPSVLSAEELARLEAERPAHFGEKIRGPEWGTLLGAEHVSALGGQKRLAAKAPAAQVVALASGGAYVQATETPAELETPAGRARLAELRAYLAPVRSDASPT